MKYRLSDNWLTVFDDKAIQVVHIAELELAVFWYRDEGGIKSCGLQIQTKTARGEYSFKANSRDDEDFSYRFEVMHDLASELSVRRHKPDTGRVD